MLSVRWRRKDPVTQLPPGVTHAMTNLSQRGSQWNIAVRLLTPWDSILEEKQQESRLRLSSQAQEQLGLKLNITSQQQHSTKLTLANSSTERYRLFALWQVGYRINVDALTLPTDNPGARKPEYGSHSHGFRPAWTPRQKRGILSRE